jgi:hypothetical protein
MEYIINRLQNAVPKYYIRIAEISGMEIYAIGN